MLRLPRLAAVAAALLLAASTAHGKPAHKKALADHYGPALPPRLADCRTCHVADTSGDDESEKPHNPFGARLKAVRDELRKAGKPSDLAARLDAIADEDSDKDGISNILELFSGHAPGDAADKPSDAELSRAREAVAAWRRGRAAYAWKPFEPVRRPPVPTPRDPAWARNPIDAFLAVEHEKQNLTPRPEAPRAVLLRRVYLDLTGLPPTREELHAFLADTSPDAYEKVVARLLDSPHYGERWGRHWMDVWRYSDWAGYGAEVRESQPHIWRWRDWIIESLNADKGYDRMVQEMLAGDELAPADPDTLRATGFLVRHWYVFNRNTWLDNVVEHTAKAFLGVTLNCARCHDHFYDAIRQEEYYQVRAFFEPYAVRTDRLPGQPDRTRAGLVRAYDAFPEPKRFCSSVATRRTRTRSGRSLRRFPQPSAAARSRPRPCRCRSRPIHRTNRSSFVVKRCRPARRRWRRHATSGRWRSAGAPPASACCSRRRPRLSSFVRPWPGRTPRPWSWRTRRWPWPRPAGPPSPPSSAPSGWRTTAKRTRMPGSRPPRRR
jgi:hypothetical protein